jgi:hypothetical protein
MDETEDDIPPKAPLHQAVGEAIEEYSDVEATLASLLRHLLKTSILQSHAIFFAISNVRSRLELFDTLLAVEFGGELKQFWNSCTKFLVALANFRNAIVHWHPQTIIYVDEKTETTVVKHALGHPTFHSSYKPLEIEDFAPFIKDCILVKTELSSLIFLAKERPRPLPDKFQQPIARRNQAVLQPLRKPKTPKARRQASPRSGEHKQSKLSSKQRRMQALGRAKRKP